MTRPALISQADLMRMAAIAKKTGMRVEVEIDGKIIRVAPDIQTKAPDASPEEFTSFAEWQAWRDRERAREASSSARSPLDIPFHEVPPSPIQPMRATCLVPSDRDGVFRAAHLWFF